MLSLLLRGRGVSLLTTSCRNVSLSAADCCCLAGFRVGGISRLEAWITPLRRFVDEGKRRLTFVQYDLYQPSIADAHRSTDESQLFRLATMKA